MHACVCVCVCACILCVCFLHEEVRRVFASKALVHSGSSIDGNVSDQLL